MWIVTFVDQEAIPGLAVSLTEAGHIQMRNLGTDEYLSLTDANRENIVSIIQTLLDVTLPGIIPGFYPKVLAGPLADRPAAGQPGGEERFYIATDGPAWYVDDGSAWQLLIGADAEPEAASMRSLGIGAQQAALPGHQHEPSLLFNQAQSMVTVNDYASIQNLWDGGGTLEVWINPFNAGQFGNGHVARKTNPNGWFFQVFGLSSGKVRIHFLKHFSEAYGAWSSQQAVVPVNHLSHVAITYNADNPANQPVMYVNGRQVAVVQGNTPAGVRSSEASVPLVIGNNPAGNRTLEGIIVDFRLWTTVRTQEQIQANMNTQLTGNEPGLVGYWRVYEGQGSTIYNAVSGGLHGTASGVTWT